MTIDDGDDCAVPLPLHMSNFACTRINGSHQFIYRACACGLDAKYNFYGITAQARTSEMTLADIGIVIGH